MATVGQALTAPEATWRRYDDTDSRIKYEGDWIADVNSVYNLSTAHYCNTMGNKIIFIFYGSKFRIITSRASSHSDNIKITIDGITETFSEKDSSPSIRQALSFEKTNLTLATHLVEIELVSVASVDFDAIDIDDRGYLIHPTLNQVSDIDSMQIGDCIPCRYTALTSGVAGYFSELGTCIANEIPVTGIATPDGLFYLIKTDKGTLIADRVIQTNISWDVLNSARFIEGTDGKFNVTIPTTIIDGSTSGVTKTGTLLSGICKSICTNATGELCINSGYRPILEPFTAVYKIKSLTKEHGYDNKNFVYLYIHTANQIAMLVKVECDNTNFYISSVGSANILTLPKTNEGLTIIASTLDKTKILVNDNVFIGATIDVGWVDRGGVMFEHHYANSTGWIETNMEYCGYIPLALDVTKLITQKSFIRSLSGGCAYTDANGNKSLTNQNLGAFPINNEWDKYIVNSDLNGKITKEDVDIWHHHRNANNSNGTTSLCKDTISLSIDANTTRVLRGRYTYSPTSQNYVNLVSSQSSSAASVAWGFRPLLNYVESDIQSEVI